MVKNGASGDGGGESGVEAVVRERGRDGREKGDNKGKSGKDRGDRN
ncbi:hypothetical protein A2U01_0020060 [Trifolium medium]|uniref:Uncharacterized protein n=1 Tax=Trifolium medium TaxID=97028 RepID=A0A392NII3_9FABA|nr:hypothetical protein [Trifolium medium]